MSFETASILDNSVISKRYLSEITVALSFTLRIFLSDATFEITAIAHKITIGKYIQKRILDFIVFFIIFIPPYCTTEAFI